MRVIVHPKEKSQNRRLKDLVKVLVQNRVRAMKEAGIWDDPNKRRDMIKRYMDQDKQSKA